MFESEFESSESDNVSDTEHELDMLKKSFSKPKIESKDKTDHAVVARPLRNEINFKEFDVI